MKRFIDKLVGWAKDAVVNTLGWLNAIAKDKYQHFAVGAVIALAVLIVTMPLGSWGRWLPLLASMIAVMTAAILKERRIDPKADMQDILATLAGGAVIWAEFVVIALIAQ